MGQDDEEEDDEEAQSAKKGAAKKATPASRPSRRGAGGAQDDGGIRHTEQTKLPALGIPTFYGIPKVMFTGLEDAKLKENEKLVRALGGTIATKETDCTHLIHMDNKIKRKKELLCSYPRCYVVGRKWLENCAKAGKFVTEEILVDKAFERENGVDMTKVLSENIEQEKRVFTDLSFYVVDTQVPLEDIKAMITSQGGKLEKKPSKDTLVITEKRM